jgi:predicted Zn-dependent protease
MARNQGDLLERTGTDAGDSLRSKKGDFVLGIDPSRTRGVDLRVVIEAKDRSVSLRRFSAELAEARENRRAAVALAIFTPQSAPTSVAPLALIGSDVYCVYDPETDDAVALEAAVRLARILALASLRESSVQLDVPAVQEALAEIVRQVGEVQGAKARLTSISNAATDVARTLDTMRATILRSVKEVETQLEVVEAPADAPGALSA